MRLILVRHAKARNRKKWNKDDLKRPLTKKGMKQAKKLAKYISKKYSNADAILTSLALRSLDTAKYIVKQQAHCAFFLTPSLNPDKSIEEFLKHQVSIKKDWRRLIVVGHEPAISEFLRSLALDLHIGKGCVVELERQNKGRWVLIGLNNF